MAGLSSKLCLLLTVFTAWLNFVVAAGPSVHINEHWVDIKVEDNAVSLAIQYIDFTPATSPEQPVQLASKNCQVTLELDQLPAGYQFAVTNITHWASVHFPRWDWWKQRFVTDVYYNSGDGDPATRSEIIDYMGTLWDVDGTVFISSDRLGWDPMWSPCFEANGTTEMFIYDRVALGTGGMGMPSGWFTSGDFRQPYTTGLLLNWRTC
ncbi:hypothetical protein F5882DRAFT_493111 [Hyaloscypha sp. PMI_1271]|nr:hypothetical protein F5882DRAFT_493111 [Hyaloscypha sp. PMI_1271]